MRIPPAIKRRKLVKTRAEIPCAIRYWPLVPDKPQAIPATTVNRVPFKLFDMSLLTLLYESSPSLDYDLQSIETLSSFHRYDSIEKIAASCLLTIPHDEGTCIARMV